MKLSKVKNSRVIFQLNVHFRFGGKAYASIAIFRVPMRLIFQHLNHHYPRVITSHVPK